MAQTNNQLPTFNLWIEPWISLEDPKGDLSKHGIRDALINADKYTAIYDPSPLVVVGIYRLLTGFYRMLGSTGKCGS